MKAGTRILGVAESYRQGENRSTLSGVVVRVDRSVDGFAFGRATVGGLDATETVAGMVDDLDRPDVRYVLLAGIAPAWYNLLDLPRLHGAVERPVVSVSFEDSEGLAPALADAFDGAALDRRREIYDRQPPRTAVSVGDETVYCRAVGIDDSAAADLLRATTASGGRPEPVRVARQAARAANAVLAGES
jgi:endonuclease V-like protein UPF0215 family